MREITIQWENRINQRFNENGSVHHEWEEKEMRVTKSDHPKYAVGSIFDFGFFTIATNEGYKIISLP